MILNVFSFILKMTVVESYAGGKKTDTEQLPATITSLVVEGISQNTTGSIFVPEVSFKL